MFDKNIYFKKIKEKIISFDFFELGNSFLLYYILIFGLLLSVIILEPNSKYVKYALAQESLIFDIRIFIYLLLGILSFWTGYKFLSVKSLTSESFKFLNKKWERDNVVFVFISIFLINFFIKLIRILGGGYFHWSKSLEFVGGKFYSLIGLLDWFGPIVLAMVFAYYFYLYKANDNRYKIWQIISWAVFAIEFFYGFFSLSKFSAIIPIIIYLIVKNYVYSKSFLRVVIVGCLVFFVLMPTMNFYKSRINFYSYNINDDKNFEIKDRGKFVIDSSIGRVNQSKIIFNVFEKTDKFLYGKSLFNFFISLGPPRFIWKNKPIINANGNDFGRAYGIINSDNYQTTVGPTILGDWYMNFGVWGIIFGMMFFGFLYRFIFDLFIKKSDNSLSGVVIYAVFWVQIIKGTEDWIAPVWAGLVKLFVIFLVIYFLLAGFKFRRSDSR